MSDTQKHTPGPWFVPHANEVFKDMDATVTGPTGQVCQLPTHPGLTREQAEANARLIAAAPDLLKFCKLMYQTADLADHLLDDIEAAIARAEGGR